MTESQPEVGIEFLDGETKNYEAVVIFLENDWLAETPFNSDDYAVGFFSGGRIDIINRENIKRIIGGGFPMKNGAKGAFVYKRLSEDIDVEDIKDHTTTVEYAKKLVEHWVTNLKIDKRLVHKNFSNRPQLTECLVSEAVGFPERIATHDYEAFRERQRRRY